MAVNQDLFMKIGKMEAQLESLQARMDALEDQLGWVAEMSEEVNEGTEAGDFATQMLAAFKLIKSGAPVIREGLADILGGDEQPTNGATAPKVERAEPGIVGGDG